MTGDSRIEPLRRAVDVRCPPAEAFRLFTDQIDACWRFTSNTAAAAEQSSHETARGRRPQLLRDVLAEKAVSTGTVLRPLHLGHTGLAFSRSATVIIFSNWCLHFVQRKI
jgi:hypothetical protein